MGCSRDPECGFTHPLHPIRGAIVSDTDDPDFVATVEDPDAVMYPKVLGVDPATGKEISLRLGPYGPYLQLGVQELAPAATPAEDGKKAKKPKKPPAPRRVGVANIGKDVNEITLAEAVGKFEYPQVLCVHPVTPDPVSLNIGPFGRYFSSEVACEVLRTSNV